MSPRRRRVDGPRRVAARYTLAAVLLVGACGGESEGTEEATAPAATSAPTPWVSVMRPNDASLLEAPAVVRATGAAGAVSSSVAVRVVRLHVQAGTVVRAGDPVVDVTAPMLLDAAASYVGARRGARAHGERAGELDELRAEGLVDHSRVFERRARSIDLTTEHGRAGALLRSAGVEPSAAASLLRRGFVTLNAPVDGVVSSLPVHIGEIREPGAGPLARIIGEGAARIEVRTPEAWPTATSLHFEASDARVIELTATPLSAVIDPDDGTHLSWYAPAAEVALPDGLTGTVRLTAADDVWEVPVRAVHQRTGASEVVRRRDGQTERVPVTVLGSSGATALVRGDLTAADEVRDDISRIEPDTNEDTPETLLGEASEAEAAGEVAP